MTSYRAVIALVGIAMLSACTGEAGERDLAAACRYQLDQAGRELSHAKAQGFGDSVAWSKAASLLAAAKVQQTFEEYQNCLEKSRQARQYLASIQN